VYRSTTQNGTAYANFSYAIELRPKKTNWGQCYYYAGNHAFNAD